MAGFFILLWGLLCCLTAVVWADPPTVLIGETYSDRGEFYHVTLAEEDTTAPGVYLSGIGLQQLFQAYVMKVDTSGDALWTRLWGSTNYIFDCLWANGQGKLVGYTTENATLDYKFILFNGAGELQDQWDFGGSAIADRGISAAYYDSSSIMVVGSITPGDSSASDGSLVLIDGDGFVEWSRNYGESAVVRRVMREATGEITLFGTSDSVSGRNRDFWVGHTDSTGALLRSHRFGSLRTEELFDAVRISSELTVLVGYTRSFGDSTKTNLWVLATNDNGDSLWSDVFGSTENDAALCVAPVADRDSGFVVGGYWSEPLHGIRNAFLMKFDQDFDSVWAFTQYDTVRSSEFRDVAIDSMFKYHAAGVRNTGLPHGYYVVTSSDPAAPLQHSPNPFSLISPADNAFFVTDTIRFRWEATSDPDSGDQVAYALLMDTDSLFDNPQVIGGPLPQPTYLLTRTDDIFDRYWRVAAQDQHGNLTFCDESFRHFRKIRQDSTQEFSLLSPDNGSAIPNPFHVFSWEVAVEPDSADEQVLYCLFFQVGDSIALIDTVYETSITVDFTNHPFIHQSDTVTWWVMADSDLPEMSRHSTETWLFVNWNTSVDESGILPTEFALMPAYPNPFNASVNLQFSIALAGAVQLRIYDLTGREVATVVDEVLSPGAHVFQWTGSNVGSGVYFARLAQGDNVALQKLMLIK